MIADLGPYPEYKESGLPWLGQVPGHWETRRLRHACEMRVSNVDKHTKQGETPVRLCNYVEVYKNERIRESTRFMSASASEDERIRFCLRKGDVLITKDSEQWNDIGVPSLVEFEAPDLVCGYHLAILRARPLLHGPFLHRALECHFIAAQFHVEANGVTRYGLSHGAIQGVSIPLPPPAEQAAIVGFLDWANGRLERAIRAKRKVIALLTEQKQAIIHRAVTRGLDPSVPLKPSGIPWLGDIPQHWDFRAFARLARVVRGASPRPAGDKRFFYGGHISWLTVGEVTKDNEVYLTETETCLTELGEEHSVRFPAGTLVLTNSGATLGVPKILSVDVCANDGVVAFLLLNPIVAPMFSYYYLSTLTMRLRDEFRQGGTQPNLNTGIVRSIACPLPPIPEQQAILKFLESQLFGLRTAVSRLEREVELLREYRTRLVADVVTGKLDVREAAARLPEEAAPDTAEEPVDGLDETEPADEEAAA